MDAPTDALAPGALGNPAPFGPYLLYGMVARGGMAEVYRARRPDENRLLAIKVMRPQLAKETRFIEMFIREGRLAMMLRGDTIVHTVDVGEVGGRWYIAMEYLSGRDLTQVLRRCHDTNQRLPVPHAIAIAAAICQGLHVAHTLADADGRPLNIVNRDVSPSNVRLGFDGRVKLIDFGIAQAVLQFTSEIGILKGKFSYMSPEQIRGLPVDARSDVFSAGIVLHEMLTTEKLFRGDSEFALMEKVRKAEVAPPSKFNRRVPAELDRICLKALARDVADRYQSAGELGDDLRALLDGYRFRPDELREFMRSLFRQDVAQEESELCACLPPPEPADDEDESEIAVEVQSSAPAPSPPMNLALGGVPAVTHSDPTPVSPVAAPVADRRGLWTRLKDKLSR